MKNFSHFRGWMAVALLAMASIAPAHAQDKSMVQSCRSDFKTLCPSVQPGGGRIAECLKQHEAELSPSCKSAMGAVSACGAEVKQICGVNAATPSAVANCVKAHASEFSAACRSSMQAQ
jgi:Cysteine rich repeat